MIGAKRQDGLSTVYIGQLKTAAGRFGKAFPGEIMAISSGDIDRWLRKLGGSPVTRNSVHRCIKVLFSFAKARGYLPGAERTAAAMLPLAKEGDVETEIFTPEQIRRILCACPEHLLGYVALGAFAGLRVAEICRLNWSSVDLERRIVMLRADQAKTASRRIVPISENLAAWLSHIVHVRGPEKQHREQIRLPHQRAVDQDGGDPVLDREQRMTLPLWQADVGIEKGRGLRGHGLDGISGDEPGLTGEKRRGHAPG